ncbi:rifamycin-inactivating phosphotransferase [Tsukamurella sp. 1534]|uniref:rifamycin-inactivating phosphotransferase n=1 Tax=Tsukamurella sp. 1534 TaxID=1151061 RepID=UPI00031E4861|nr:rifamycin-inactivating phosphotransferase [Tsukamurella sp. 1534]
MGDYVLGFDEVDRTRIGEVGGKGAHLGELSRIEGVDVPAGFCVTTGAFERAVSGAPSVADLLREQEGLGPGNRDAVRAWSAELRRAVEAAPVPDEVAAEIADALAGLGTGTACAVRSSATAEDLPGASFAGQQDTYLNVTGADAVLAHIRRCWASMFSDRAVAYRERNGFRHDRVRMAVVVQRMVFPDASGVVFTADPVTSNRRVASVEATYGLGEALVSGLVNTDRYAVRDGEVVASSIADKTVALDAAPGGGTRERAVRPDEQRRAVLTDDEAVRLVALARRIEEHFGRPQDVEWCLSAGAFQIVQSRPITTLFPVPETDDGDNHVFLSVGHQQMMTDAMTPLGISFWQLTTFKPMREAGGRLFVDATPMLAKAETRAQFLTLSATQDPLTADALNTVLGRDGFLPAPREDDDVPPVPGGSPVTIETDPAIPAALIERVEKSIAAAESAIAGKSGPELFEFLLADVVECRARLFDPESTPAIMAGMQAAWWLNDNLQEWLGERNPADTLSLSVPNNVTAEMGLALLDVADAVRPHPEVIAHLDRATGDGFLDELSSLPGGTEARDAIVGYLDRYGMRCVGEIDITRPRWAEHPTAVLPMILSNVRNFEHGAGARRFEEGRREAEEKEQDILRRLRSQPDGEQRATETARMIERLRTFAGYREFPKFGMISRYWVYKKALLAEAERLVRDGAIDAVEDAYFLRIQELQEVARTGVADRELIRRRREEFAGFQRLTPPRVLTSDGEALSGSYRRDDVPDGALVGLPVSPGVVEGRARVILDVADAELDPGDILVTAYTDPSWSPLFVAIGGLVTEVGGQMTHGAVIAREYGLPAVVGVADATRVIEDGWTIRIDGTDGTVEILG